MRLRTNSATLLVWMLIFTLVFPAPAFARYKAKPRWTMMSTADEITLGQQYSAEVPKEQPLVQDAEVNRYIDALGKKLAANAPGAKYPYSFRVVNSNEINAFALPGGPVFVNLGLIQRAQTEAQLAGVIGHEISHVALRHSSNQASKALLTNMGLQVLGGKLGGSGIAGQLAQAGISFGLGSVFMKFSRDAEKEADLVGVGIAYDSGFDPRGAVEFFKILQAQSGSRGGAMERFLSDHPIPVDREQYVAKEVETLTAKKYVADSADFKAIKKKTSAMHALTAEEIKAGKGATGQTGTTAPATIEQPQDWMPSQNYKTFEHQAYTVSYPDNWQFEGSANTGIQSYPASGKKGDSFAYAMMINGAQVKGASFTEASNQLTQSLVQSNQGMSLLGEAEDFKLGGRAARSMVLSGPSPILDKDKQPEKERDWLVTVDTGDGSLIYLIFVSPDKDFKTLQPEFTRMLKSLKVK